MIAFVGACMLKVLNGVWWIMLYELLIIAAQTMMTMSGSVEQYRVTVGHMFVYFFVCID